MEALYQIPLEIFDHFCDISAPTCFCFKLTLFVTLCGCPWLLELEVHARYVSLEQPLSNN